MGLAGVVLCVPGYNTPAVPIIQAQSLLRTIIFPNSTQAANIGKSCTHGLLVRMLCRVCHRTNVDNSGEVITGRYSYSFLEGLKRSLGLSSTNP